MNNSGKTLTIFLVIIAILLICLTGISAFFLLKEMELRNVAEHSLQEAQLAQAKLEGELKAAQQQAFLLEEKYKEAKENLENLQDDLELAQGVKQKMQEENKTLTATIEKVTQEKEDIKAQLSKAQDNLLSVQADLDAAKLQNRSLEEQIKAVPEAPEVTIEAAPVEIPAENPAPVKELNEVIQDKVNLETIVVAPGEKQGKVISVDADTGFLIANLGEKDGIGRGAILSIYRDQSYLGDVQVSRVLPEMSAADFIPPLNGQQVNKDDLVKVKK